MPRIGDCYAEASTYINKKYQFIYCNIDGRWGIFEVDKRRGTAEVFFMANIEKVLMPHLIGNSPKVEFSCTSAMLLDFENWIDTAVLELEEIYRGLINSYSID